MAVLITKSADVNLTAANGFNTIEPGTAASQATRSASTNTTTSYVYSSAITDTNLNVLDGLLLYCNRVNTTGTVTVAYSQDNGTTDTRNLTVNASDLPVDPSWVFFKFGSNLTLDGGADNKVGVKASSAGNATFFRDATAGNWTRRLRLTATATAAAGDVIYIVGEITAAATTSARVVTMDQTATTDYGTGSDGAADNGIEIGNAGSLTYGTTASTNYYLKLSGSLNIWGNGTLNIGTTGTPIPRNSTAVLEFDPVADGGMGLIANPGGNLNIQGLSRTSAKNIFACKLNSDAAANATTLSVDTDTGWLDNDVIVVASTTRTATQTEKGTLNGNAGASSLTVDGFAGTAGGIANAHGGGGTVIDTVSVSAEVILLTRNVVIRSATSTIMAYVFANTTSIVDIDWAEFYYLGEAASTKRGIETSTTTGSFSMQFCSIHDIEDFGVYLASTSGSNIVVSSNVMYNLNTAVVSGNGCMFVQASSGISTIDTNYFLGCNTSTSLAAGNYVVHLADIGLTLTNLTIAGTSGGSSNTCVNLVESSAKTGTLSNFTIHSNSGGGVSIAGGNSQTLVTNIIGWRNGSASVYTGVSTINGSNNSSIWDTGISFGNANGTNLNISNVFQARNIFKSYTVDSDPSFTVSNGLTLGQNCGPVVLINSNFGSSSVHSTGDIVMGNNGIAMLYAINTILASTPELQNQTSIFYPNFIKSHKHDQSSTTYKALYRLGTIQSDQTTRHTASGYSWKLTPNNATFKLVFPGPEDIDTFKVAVNASSLVTVNGYVQKDGSYNGNAPRLVMLGGFIGGITTDQIASLTVAAGNWEQLIVSGTPSEIGGIEFYFDCDGTAGNVYVDDVTVTQ